MDPPNLSLLMIMVCFWITFWLVRKFLILPISDILEQRRERIDSANQSWESKNQEYLSATSRLENEMEEAARNGARIREELRQQAQQARQERMQRAKAEADERLKDSLVELDGDASTVRGELEELTQQLARTFAGRLLQRELRT